MTESRRARRPRPTRALALAALRDIHTPNLALISRGSTPEERQMSTVTAIGRAHAFVTPDNAVLLLIDHQVGPLWELEFRALRRRAVDLAEAAMSLGVPIVLSPTDTERSGPIIPELVAASPGATVVERAVLNAWNDEGVRGAVDATGRRKVIVAGAIGELAVETCAAAADGGYDVYAAIDASGECRHRALVWLIEAGVVITSSRLVLPELSAYAGAASVRAHGTPPRAFGARRSAPVIRAARSGSSRP